MHAGSASASAAQQAKRGKAKVGVVAPEKDEKEAASEQTDTSIKRFALLTESQAAAETLAKLAKVMLRHCFSEHEDVRDLAQSYLCHCKAASLQCRVLCSLMRHRHLSMTAHDWCKSCQCHTVVLQCILERMHKRRTHSREKRDGT